MATVLLSFGAVVQLKWTENTAATATTTPAIHKRCTHQLTMLCVFVSVSFSRRFCFCSSIINAHATIQNYLNMAHEYMTHTYSLFSSPSKYGIGFRSWLLQCVCSRDARVFTRFPSSANIIQYIVYIVLRQESSTVLCTLIATWIRSGEPVTSERKNNNNQWILNNSFRRMDRVHVTISSFSLCVSFAFCHFCDCDCRWKCVRTWHSSARIIRSFITDVFDGRAVYCVSSRSTAWFLFVVQHLFISLHHFCCTCLAIYFTLYCWWRCWLSGASFNTFVMRK